MRERMDAAAHRFPHAVIGSVSRRGWCGGAAILETSAGTCASLHKVPGQQSAHHTVQPVKHDTITGCSVVDLTHGITFAPCGRHFRIRGTTMPDDGLALLFPCFGSDAIFANCLTFNITRKHRCFPTKTLAYKTEQQKRHQPRPATCWTASDRRRMSKNCQLSQQTPTLA